MLRRCVFSLRLKLFREAAALGSCGESHSHSHGTAFFIPILMGIPFQQRIPLLCTSLALAGMFHLNRVTKWFRESPLQQCDHYRTALWSCVNDFCWLSLLDCDNNDLCLGRTVSWSSNSHWIYTKGLPTIIDKSRTYSKIPCSAVHAKHKVNTAVSFTTTEWSSSMPWLSEMSGPPFCPRKFFLPNSAVQFVKFRGTIAQQSISGCYC